VIPAYNIAPFIAEAVQSALAQTLRDLEVIVVDDGSTDDTPAVLGAIRDERLHVIRKPNGGLSSARNAGIRAARGRHVGLLDGDDIWMPEKAARQIAVLEHDPSVSVTWSHSAYLNEDGTPKGTYLLSSVANPTWQQMVVRNHVGNGSTPIGRRDDFLAAGLFDERFRTAFEEYELWPRLMRRTGRGLRLVPEVLTGYRIRRGSGSNSIEPFARQAELARRLLQEKMPDIPASLLDLGLAISYRVTARKAASLGNRAAALHYLGRALRCAPEILWRDPRMLGTAVLACSGGRGERSLMRAMRGIMAGLGRC
jgi:glycosyltransferase involved in cell wall biosynthesis